MPELIIKSCKMIDIYFNKSVDKNTNLTNRL